jgi:hypothetical protein
LRGAASARLKCISLQNGLASVVSSDTGTSQPSMRVASIAHSGFS